MKGLAVSAWAKNICRRPGRESTVVLTKAMRPLFSVLALCGALGTTILAQSNMARKYATSDSVLYVSAVGSDSNDGLSAGSAKETIEGALIALPSCSLVHDLGSYTSSYNTTPYSFNHCGLINVATGIYPISSQISITSPYITIRGSDSGSPVLNWTGTGTAQCAINWTSSPFVNDFGGTGGLYNIRIDGYGGGAGTCGIETHNLPGFHMANVVIANFSGAGSVGWFDTCDSGWNEKCDVEVVLKNNTVGWEILRGGTGGGGTFGYGRFDVKEDVFAGQIGWLVDGGPQGAAVFSYADLHITVNEVSNPANATAIQIQNGASITSNLYMIHVEAPFGIGSGTEINIGAGTSFSGVGVLDQDLRGSNVISGVFNSPAMPQLANGLFSTSEYWSITSGDSAGIVNTLTQSSPKANNWNYGNQSIVNYSGSGADSGNSIAYFGVAEKTGTGTMESLSPIFAQAIVKNTGAVHFASALTASTPTISGGGSITNAVGLTIQPQAQTGVTSAYGIVQQGSADTNILAGATTIGPGTPITSSGAGGTMAAVIAGGTVTLTSASVHPNTCQTAATVTATGVTAADAIAWAYASAPGPADRLMQVSVDVASGSVGFMRCNTSSERLTGTAMVINWRVIR